MADNGTPSAPAPQLVPVVSSDGTVVNMEAGDVPAALQQGYTLPTTGQVAAHDTAQDAQTPGSGLEAASLGAAGALTAGLVPLALAKTGVVPSARQAALKEANPILSFAGEAAGVGAGVGLGGVLDLSAPALYGNVGDLAAGLVPEGLGVAGNVSKAVLKGAAEGALYSGVSGSINEAALGDPDLNGEHVASNFLRGGLFGAGAGGLLGGLAETLPPAISAARDATSEMYSKLVGLPGDTPGPAVQAFANLASKVSGKSSDEIMQAFENRAIQANGLGSDEQIAKLARDMADSANDVQKAGKGLQDDYYQGPRADAITSGTESIPISQVQPAINSIGDKYADALNEMRAYPGNFPKANVEALQSHYDALVDALSQAKTSGDVFNALDENVTNLGKTIKGWSKAEQFGQGTNQQAIDLANQLRSAGNSVLKDPEVFGDAAAIGAADRSAYARVKATTSSRSSLGLLQTKGEFDPAKFEKLIRNTGTTKSDLAAQALKEFLAAHEDFANVSEQVHLNQQVPFSREALDSATQKLSDFQAQAPAAQAAIGARQALAEEGGPLTKLGNAALAVASPKLALVKAAYDSLKNPTALASKVARLEALVQGNQTQFGALAKKALAGLPNGAGPATALSLAVSSAQHEKFANNLQKLVSDPANLNDFLSSKTQGLANHLPQTDQSAKMATLRAVQFLQSKLPVKTRPSAFQDAQPTSPAELAIFNRYRQAVQNPAILLKQAQHGLVNKETLEAVQTVYPKLFEQMQSELLNAAALHKKAVPFSQQQAVSTILGQPVNSQLTSPAIQASQASYSTPAPSGGPRQGSKPSPKGLSKLNVAGRTAPEFGTHEPD